KCRLQQNGNKKAEKQFPLMNIDKLKEKTRDFPDSPGVYVMRDKQGEEIYIGKAVSLIKRVKSYFQSRKNMETKTMILMDHVQDIDYISTDSEVEALLLESRLVKDIKPKYNIELKWGERYPYLLVLSTDDFPRIDITRDSSNIDKEQKNVLFMERFTGVKELRAGIHILQRVFRFRTCRLSIKESDKKRKYTRPCLLYHIKRCTGPCGARISKKEYRNDIDRFISFLNGEKDAVLETLENGMQKASDERRYEDAARLRDETQLIHRMSEDGGLLEYDPLFIPFIAPEESLDKLKKELKLETVPARIEGVDISHTAGHQNVGSVVTFINGMPHTQGYRRFKIKQKESTDDVSMIQEVVSRRISRLIKEKKDLPDIMLIDGGKGQVQAAADVFEKYNVSRSVKIIGIAKGNEDLYIPGRRKPVRLPKTSPALKLLCYVRDEAHRFAQVYHKLLRKKDFEE
ncbi:GIY-YIG nuclease family protein, partial [Planctomycetota bacterium]